MRAIPEWMNGFPLRDIVSQLLHGEDFQELIVRPNDWSTSVWEEMILFIGTPELMKLNVICSLEEVLRGKLR